ncbi:hypothetical protein EBZ39_09650 [bacterium]|nr:hypothetical protein [bacterium]
MVDSLEALEAHPAFRKAEQEHPRLPGALEEAAGIIVCRRPRQRDNSLKTFQARHPDFVVVSLETGQLFSDKEATFNLLSAAGQRHLLPDFAIYDSAYTPELAEEIRQRFHDCSYLVIKPTTESMARGVNMLACEDVPKKLAAILNYERTRRRKRLIADGTQPINSKISPRFMVNAFCPSQPIFYHGRPYDPTMRVMFVMWHNQGTITVNILGGCWKIAGAPLDDPNAHLHAKHITDPVAYGPVLPLFLVEAEDIAGVKALLAPALAAAYKTLLLTA